MGSSEPRCTQTTSASRSNVKRHAHRLPFGHGLTTGFNSRACEDPLRFGLDDVVGFALRMSFPLVSRPRLGIGAARFRAKTAYRYSFFRTALRSTFASITS